MNKIKISLTSGATLIVLDVLFFLMVVIGVPANVLFFQNDTVILGSSCGNCCNTCSYI